MKLIVNFLLLTAVPILGQGTHAPLAPLQTVSIALTVWADSLANKDVRVLYRDSKNRLWAGTRHSGLFVFEQNQVTDFDKDNGLLSNGITAIIEDSHNNIWVAGGGGLSTFSNGEWINYSLEQIGLKGRVAFSVYEDSKKQIWCSAPGGAAKFDGKLWRIINEQDGLSHAVVHDVIEDARGRIWFATRKGGLNELNNGTFEYHLPEVNCRALMIARNGDLWIGTGGAGAIRYDGKQFTAYDGYHTLLPKHEDNDGHLWFATENNFVLKYDGEGWHTFSLRVEAATHTVITMNRYVLIGTSQGIKILQR